MDLITVDKEEEFFDNEFKSFNSGSKEEFDDMYEEYKNQKENMNLPPEVFNSLLMRLVENQQIYNIFDEWAKETLLENGIERIPTYIAKLLLKNDYSGMYAYKLKNVDVINKIFLN